jgi:hypothetical protein
VRQIYVEFFSDLVSAIFFFAGEAMVCRIQQLAQSQNLTFDDFVGEMRKRGCSEPTALKIWLGLYEEYTDFNDNDLYLSNLRKAADVLKVTTGTLLPK